MFEYDMQMLRLNTYLRINSLTQVWEWINIPLPAILRFTRAQGCGSMPISFIIGEMPVVDEITVLDYAKFLVKQYVETIVGEIVQ